MHVREKWFWKSKATWVAMGADQEIELSGWTMQCAQTFSAFPFILLYSWVHRVHVHAYEWKDTLTHRIQLLKGINETFYFVCCVKEHSTVCDCVCSVLCSLCRLRLWDSSGNSIEIPSLGAAIHLKRVTYLKWFVTRENSLCSCESLHFWISLFGVLLLTSSRSLFTVCENSML